MVGKTWSSFRPPTEKGKSNLLIFFPSLVCRYTKEILWKIKLQVTVGTNPSISYIIWDYVCTCGFCLWFVKKISTRKRSWKWLARLIFVDLMKTGFLNLFRSLTSFCAYCYIDKHLSGQGALKCIHMLYVVYCPLFTEFRCLLWFI